MCVGQDRTEFDHVFKWQEKGYWTVNIHSEVRVTPPKPESKNWGIFHPCVNGISGTSSEKEAFWTAVCLSGSSEVELTHHGP